MMLRGWGAFALCVAGKESISPKLSTSKGEIVENKQSLSSPAGERENIMGTMDINPLLIKLRASR